MSASEKDEGRRRRKTAKPVSAGPASGAEKVACGEKWGWGFTAAISGRWLWGFRRRESTARGRASGEEKQWVMDSWRRGVLTFWCGFSGAVWAFRSASFCAFCLLVEVESGNSGCRTDVRVIKGNIPLKATSLTSIFLRNFYFFKKPFSYIDF